MKYGAIIAGSILGLLVDCDTALSARGSEGYWNRKVLQLGSSGLGGDLLEMPSSSYPSALNRPTYSVSVAANAGSLSKLLKNMLQPIGRTVQKQERGERHRGRAVKRRERVIPNEGQSPRSSVVDPSILPKSIPIPLDRPTRDHDNSTLGPMGDERAKPQSISWAEVGVLLPLTSLIFLFAVIGWIRTHRRARRKWAFNEKNIYSAIMAISDNGDALVDQMKIVFSFMAQRYSLDASAFVAVENETGRIKEVMVSTIDVVDIESFVSKIHMEKTTQNIHEGNLSLLNIGSYADNTGGSCVSNRAVFFMHTFLCSKTYLLYIGITGKRRSVERDKEAVEGIAQLFALKVGKVRKAGNQFTDDANGVATELAGRVAHEFRNVLTSITGYAEMAAEAVRPGSSPHRYIEHIQKAGDRARQIIDHTLEGVRSVSGVAFDVVDATNELFPDLKTFIPQEIYFGIEIPKTPIYVKGDRTKFQQIIINLCRNSAESICGEGKVEIHISNVFEKYARSVSHGQLIGGYAQVSVIDTGHGIKEEHFMKISRISFTTKKSSGGTGLGLPMIFDAVADFGGALNIISRSGTGTRFEVFIPLSEPVITDNESCSRTFASLR